MRIQEVMTNSPVCGKPDSSLEDIAKMMVDCDCGAIPIIKGNGAGKPVGMVTDRDIVCRAVAKGQNPLDLVASDVMTQKVICVHQDTDLDDAVRLMEDNHIRRLVVLDDDDQVCGIISQADIALKAPEHTTSELLKEVSEPGTSPSTLH